MLSSTLARGDSLPNLLWGGVWPYTFHRNMHADVFVCLLVVMVGGSSRCSIIGHRHLHWECL